MSGNRPVEAAGSSGYLLAGGLMLASLLIFWLTDLDLWAAALFFDSDHPAAPWPVEALPLWRFLYFAVPVFTTALAAGSLLALALGLGTRRLRSLRLPTALMVLTLALGPGLLVNVLCKDVGGRPRPRQVEQFGGTLQYLPPLAMGDSATGHSLAAGHPSVGFSLLAFWLLYRRRRPGLARFALALSVGLGLLLGVGRMTAGAHFLSDILLTGYLTFLTVWVLYQHVLRIPEHERKGEAEQGRPLLLFYSYSLVGTLIIVGALTLFPLHMELDYRIDRLPSPPPQHLRLELERANLAIRFRDGRPGPPSLVGDIHGRGLPNHQIRAVGWLLAGETPLLLYRVMQRGFFTSLDARLVLELDASRWRRLEVHLGEGDIELEHIGNGPLPELELETGKGRIVQPLPPGAPGDPAARCSSGCSLPP